MQLGDDEIEDLLDFMDVDGSGTIDYHEFVMGVLEDKQLLTEAKLQAAFDYFDLDHNGKIDIGECLLATCTFSVVRSNSQSHQQAGVGLHHPQSVCDS